MKRLTKLLLLFLPLHTQAAYLCTATSDHYPAFTDGIVFSKEVELEGPQGMPNGHIDLHHQSGFDFRLVAGRTMVQNGNKQLIDFYIEPKFCK
ncbi:hypothetical protein OLMES_0209 [Oleiphilus messinensis]|uniref:Uncharacterized protein n=1 Tax=Oleiphilus messinensis TaxID=141451 RepID=A0A1Y0I3E1_9GAMM|nr:hypothetical protein [Oleiphilus messinensis]ARU54316.1 hypothetical protein OLMES_0209 [Oleiphilus messinensis]